MHTAVHPQQAQSLGSWQWGIQNRNRQTLWSSKLTTLAKALPAVAKSLTLPPKPHDTFSQSVAKPAPTLPATAALDAMIHERLFTQGVTLHALRHFNAVEHIHRTAQHPPTQEETAVWSSFMTALAMPGGMQWLESQGALHLPSTAEQRQWLEDLAKACVTIHRNTGQFPSIAWQSAPPQHTNDMATRSANHTLLKLCGLGAEATPTHWETNALRNGLDPQRHPQQFHRIEQRLLKMGRWLDRAERQQRWGLAGALKGKHPFQLVRLGLLGADQGGPQPVAETAQHNHKPFRRTDFLQRMHHLVDTIQGASRLRWYGGGRVGLGLQGLSIRLAQLLSGLLIRIKIKLSLHHIRQAGVELAMPPYNLELLVVSRRGQLFRAGAGLGVGPALEPVDVHVSAELEALQNDRNHMEGIALRMPRIRGQETVLRTRFKALLSDLVNKPSNFDKPGDFLKHLLAKYPELSISELGHYREQGQSHAVQVEATAGLKTAVVELAGSLFTKLRWIRKHQRELLDNTGVIRVHKKTQWHGVEHSAGARVDFKSPLRSTDPSMNMGSPYLWATDWVLGSAGRSFRQDWVQSNGLVHPMSFIEVEYQHMEDFEAMIKAHHTEWIEERSHQKQCSKDQALRDLNAFLETCRNNRASNLTYAARAELRPDRVAQVNRALALLALLGNTNLTMSTQLRSGIDAIRENPASYQPTSFRVYNRQSDTRRQGLQIGLQLERFDQADGVHAQYRLM
ncbi:MAG TPA: hypothetical protein VGE55_12320 [Limnobacter sp.]|uniref:hypothetical protein n=1 Tax=Limnobacter sp. TaxID=2003368 RepID=UPI002ED9F54C